MLIWSPSVWTYFKCIVTPHRAHTPSLHVVFWRPHFLLDKFTHDGHTPFVCYLSVITVLCCPLKHRLCAIELPCTLNCCRALLEGEAWLVHPFGPQWNISIYKCNGRPWVVVKTFMAPRGGILPALVILWLFLQSHRQVFANTMLNLNFYNRVWHSWFPKDKT